MKPIHEMLKADQVQREMSRANNASHPTQSHAQFPHTSRLRPSLPSQAKAGIIGKAFGIFGRR